MTEVGLPEMGQVGYSLPGLAWSVFGGFHSDPQDGA